MHAFNIRKIITLIGTVMSLNMNYILFLLTLGIIPVNYALEGEQARETHMHYTTSTTNTLPLTPP
jgi:hypothetical protein